MRSRLNFPLAVFLCGTATLAQETSIQPKPSSTQQVKYYPVTKGVMGRTRLESDLVRGYHMVVQDLTFGPRATAEIPVSGTALMELRAGHIDATLDGKQLEVQAGDFWVVEPNAHLTVHNKDELAVIRTTTFVSK
jgi:hypothetical protein